MTTITLSADRARRLATGLLTVTSTVKGDVGLLDGAQAHDGCLYATNRYAGVKMLAGPEFPDGLYLPGGAIRALAKLPAAAVDVTIEHDTDSETVTVGGVVFDATHRTLPPVWSLWTKFSDDQAHTYSADATQLSKILAWASKHVVPQTTRSFTAIRKTAPVKIRAVQSASGSALIVTTAGAEFIIQEA